jgi:hypothetical protein
MENGSINLRTRSRRHQGRHLRIFSGKMISIYHTSAACWSAIKKSAVAAFCNGGAESPHTSGRLYRNLPRRRNECRVSFAWEFRIEAGVQLFGEISGDQFTVLGALVAAAWHALRELGDAHHDVTYSHGVPMPHMSVE